MPTWNMVMEYAVKAATGHPTTPKGGTLEYRNGPWYKTIGGRKQGERMGKKKRYGYGPSTQRASSATARTTSAHELVCPSVIIDIPDVPLDAVSIDISSIAGDAMRHSLERMREAADIQSSPPPSPPPSPTEHAMIPCELHIKIEPLLVASLDAMSIDPCQGSQPMYTDEDGDEAHAFWNERDNTWISDPRTHTTHTRCSHSPQVSCFTDSIVAHTFNVNGTTAPNASILAPITVARAAQANVDYVHELLRQHFTGKLTCHTTAMATAADHLEVLGLFWKMRADSWVLRSKQQPYNPVTKLKSERQQAASYEPTLHNILRTALKIINADKLASCWSAATLTTLTAGYDTPPIDRKHKNLLDACGRRATCTTIARTAAAAAAAAAACRRVLLQLLLLLLLLLLLPLFRGTGFGREPSQPSHMLSAESVGDRPLPRGQHDRQDAAPDLQRPQPQRRQLRERGHLRG